MWIKNKANRVVEVTEEHGKKMIIRDLAKEVEAPVKKTNNNNNNKK